MMVGMLRCVRDSTTLRGSRQFPIAEDTVQTGQHAAPGVSDCDVLEAAIRTVSYETEQSRESAPVAQMLDDLLRALYILDPPRHLPYIESTVQDRPVITTR